MPLDGNGNWTPAGSSVNPAVIATAINQTDYNALVSDLKTALSTAMFKDGQATPTANIKMGSFKFTGLAAGTTAGDSARYEQVLLLAGGTMTGSLLFTDATYDIGASGATRPRDLFLSRNAAIGGLADLSGAGAGQIKFPATQNPSSDANTLDDYEEGTWTPALTFGGAAVGMTYSTQAANYTKVGNRVMIDLSVVLSAKGSSTGSAVIGGLPFTVAAYAGLGGRIDTVAAALNGQFTMLFNQSATTIAVQKMGNAATAVADLTNSDFANTTNIFGGGNYKV